MKLSIASYSSALATLIIVPCMGQLTNHTDIRPILSKVPFWEKNITSSKPFEPNFVFYDVSAQQYVVTYPANMVSGNVSDGTRLEFRVDIQSTVEPTVVANFIRSAHGVYKYSYLVTNEKSARTDLRRLSLVASAEDDEISINQNGDWLSQKADIPQNSVVREGGPALRVRANSGRIVSWRAEASSVGLTAGSTKDGFALESRFLPGVTIAYSSNEIPWLLPANLPAAVNEQLALVSGPETIWKATVTIGPKFSPTDAPTNDVVWIANDFRVALERLRALGTLPMESKFVDELDSFLDNIIVLGQRSPFRLRNQPSSDLESKILKAAVESLGQF